MPRRGTKRSHSFTDDRRGPRLQRVLADAGVGSRRHCEALIEEGAVSVNGEVVDALPAWVDPAQDRIAVNGRPLPRRERSVHVMLYKPKGIVSTNADPEGRRRAIDLVRHPSGARLFPVGRLDIDSSGLLLLTNDGELANRLTHPRYEVHKLYEVTVGGTVPDGDLAHLEQGIYLPGPRGAPGTKTERSSLRILKRDRTRTLLLMELAEGRNRQIRRMFQQLGHPVKKLRRVQMGPLRLRGLAVGEWRELTAPELAELRRQAFRTPEERRAPRITRRGSPGPR
ncbi:MAG: rRNA pseudouridine synthase [Phycisphaerae bacterium]|nr:rRNA pseudouridine synthase [Phycisphaerae bacterium]